MAASQQKNEFEIASSAEFPARRSLTEGLISSLMVAKEANCTAQLSCLNNQLIRIELIARLATHIYF